jgi:peptide/nickel transport system permease protein
MSAPAITAPLAPRAPGMRRFFRRARRAPSLIAGTALLIVIIGSAVLAPVLATHDPAQQDLTGILLAPSAEHWLGTDQLGRDVWSRMLFAGRTDLSIATLAVIVPFVVGTSLGLLAGAIGGWVDWIVMRLTDTVIAFPFYVIVISIVFAVGAGTTGIFVAVALVGWITFARVVRGSARAVRDAGWLAAARGLGLSPVRVLTRHLLPNVMPQAIVVLMTEIVLIMVAVVTLGYLGLGVQPPTPDWGNMIADGQAFVTTKWWISVIPGVAVVTTGVAFSLVGDGLSDVWRSS